MSRQMIQAIVWWTFLVLLVVGLFLPPMPNNIPAASVGTGWLSVSPVSTGVLSTGLLSVGVFSVGFFSVGIFAFGAFSLGVFSFGTFAVGLWAAGLFTMSREQIVSDPSPPTDLFGRLS